MWAAERGICAAPSDKPRLDLAKAKSATGNANDADQYVKDEVLNRSDDDDPPPRPTVRTAGVLGLGHFGDLGGSIAVMSIRSDYA